ncbi:unnamed protein product, partial [Laminaria digitata]
MSHTLGGSILKYTSHTGLLILTPYTSIAVINRRNTEHKTIRRRVVVPPLNSRHLYPPHSCYKGGKDLPSSRTCSRVCNYCAGNEVTWGRTRLPCYSPIVLYIAPHKFIYRPMPCLRASLYIASITLLPSLLKTCSRVSECIQQ